MVKNSETVKAAAEKGLYVVTPDRKGAGPPREGKYTESQRSYYARKYMQIHSTQPASKKGKSVDDEDR